MKKKLLVTGMLLTTLLFGICVKAEEGENTNNSIEQTTTETRFNDGKNLSEGAFADKYINIKLQIELLVKNEELTKEQGDSLLSKVESAKTVEELDIIWQEVEKQVTTNKNLSEGAFADKYINIKLQIELLMKNGELTKEQGDSFLAKVESAKTVEELDIIWQEIEKQVTTNKNLSEGAFADKYINIKLQIELLVKNGELTKEQGDSFLAKVESAKTVEELDIIWQEVEKQVTTNKMATSSTEKETKKDSKTTNQLPKTGESKINIGLVGIGFALILFFVVIKFKSRKLNN